MKSVSKNSQFPFILETVGKIFLQNTSVSLAPYRTTKQNRKIRH